MEHFCGAHTIDTGGIHMAVRRAGNADRRAMQLFTASPKYYGDRVSIRPERVTRFKEALAATKIAPERVVVHAAYVLNVATPDETKWTRARDGLAKELRKRLLQRPDQRVHRPARPVGRNDPDGLGGIRLSARGQGGCEQESSGDRPHGLFSL